MLSSIFLFLSFSASEIMFILFVALILFGGDKFPEIARGLGKGIREFKDMSDGVKREIHQQINSYEANPNRDNETTTNTVSDTPAADAHDAVSTDHETSETPNQHVSDTHEVHETPVVPPPIETPPASAPVTREAKEVPKKPNLTPPPNTISNQSY